MPASVDHRSDLYSPGIVVYEALTGRQPIHAESIVDLLTRITSRNEPIPPLLACIPIWGRRSMSSSNGRWRVSHRPAFSRRASLSECVYRARRYLLVHQRPIKVLVVDDEDDIPILIRHRLGRRFTAGDTPCISNEGDKFSTNCAIIPILIWFCLISICRDGRAYVIAESARRLIRS